MTPARIRAAATSGRGIVAGGAAVLVVSTLMQWWQAGGGPGELPLRSDVGISDGRVFLLFLAAAACLLLVTLSPAAGHHVAIDHPRTYMALLGVAVVGDLLRVLDLAQRQLVPSPPTHGVGFWLALAGLVVLAIGVWRVFRERFEGTSASAVAVAVEPDRVADAGRRVLDGPRPIETPEEPEQPLYVPAAVMRFWHRFAGPSDSSDRSAALNSEPRGRLDLMDVWVVVALVVVLMSMRVYNLGQPVQMYFDEVYHARTATEFLQDWRYGLDHSIYEWTHPPLAKYAIAGGITLFSDDQVKSVGQLNVAVKDAVIQERTATSPGSPTAADAGAEVDYGTVYGDRVFVATGSDVRVYDLETGALAHVYSIPGASALSQPTAGGLVYAGTSDGTVYSIDTNSLDDVRSGLTPTAGPAVQLGVDAGMSIARLYAADTHYLLASDSTGDLVSIDLSVAGGEISGRGLVPGIAGFAAVGATSDSNTNVLVAYHDGVGVLNVATASVTSTVATKSPATSIALNPEVIQESSTVRYYRYYVTAGDSLSLLRVEADSSPVAASLESSQPLATMPGPVSQVVFDESTRLALALGRTPDGTGWTVYTIESNGNAVFSDARLPFQPLTIGLDNATQIHGPDSVTEMPNADRETLLAFGTDGATASVDVGQFAFSWRIVGVMFGVLMAVCLYLLARLLFRRRSVGLLVAFFSVVDGMLFAQSRIAMNDTYVGGFLLLAYLIFAVLWLQVWKNRLVFWLGMPALGVVLGLALVSKWVAFYAIASIGVLILIRSALGRLVTILALVAGTGVLGWQALAEMQYAPGTGNVPLTLALVAAGVVVAALGTARVVATRLVPDKIVVGSAAGLAAAALLGAALFVSPGPVDNGAPNYTFFVIMLAITCIAAAANAYLPVAWTREELYFAVASPCAFGLAGPFVLALLFVPFGFPFDFVAIGRVALEAGAVGVAVGVAAGVTFWVAGRYGFGPLAAPPRAGCMASFADPPSPAPGGWLRLGSGFGVPAAWTMFCVAVLPFLVYIVLYIPWSMPWQQETTASGPLPVIACWNVSSQTYTCDQAWPAGHTGGNLWDLTVEMYNYHNNLRSPHAASSPWWAWPLDLKPVWFESGGNVPGMFSWIHDGGNPALWWMAIAGIAFVTWQALKRRNLGLGLIAVAFFWQWLSWARIDRAAFEYHFYTALPFFLLALAYFMAELWHGPSRLTWLLARVAGAGALLLPGVLWLLKPGLCGLARVDVTQYFQNTACGSGTGDVVITTRDLLIGLIVAAALVATAIVWWRLERRVEADRGGHAADGRRIAQLADADPDRARRDGRGRRDRPDERSHRRIDAGRFADVDPGLARHRTVLLRLDGSKPAPVRGGRLRRRSRRLRAPVSRPVGVLAAEQDPGHLLGPVADVAVRLPVLRESAGFDAGGFDQRRVGDGGRGRAPSRRHRRHVGLGAPRGDGPAPLGGGA